MERTRNPYFTPGLRLLNCYMLLCSGNRAYTLGRLAEILKCSRQTVLRMMEQIALLPDVELNSWMEHGERRFQVKPQQRVGLVSLDIESIRHLVLCRDIVRHLLPAPLQEEIRRTIGAATVLLTDRREDVAPLDSIAEARTKGSIDYTPFQRHLDTIQAAMQHRQVCQARYRQKIQEPEKTFRIAPLKIVAFREALYVRCRVLDKKNCPAHHKAINLAIHRIRELRPMPQTFSLEVAQSDDDTCFFGFQFNEPFQVKVAFSPSVATYVGERVWSRDQHIRRRKDGSIVLTFTTTSRPEAISWIMSFGPEAELLAPKDLRDELLTALKRAAGRYQGTVR